METSSRSTKKAVSREELLRQWRDERRAKKQRSQQQQQPQQQPQQQHPHGPAYPPHGPLSSMSRPPSSFSFTKLTTALRQQPSGPSSSLSPHLNHPHINTKRIKVRVRRSDHSTPNKPVPDAITTLYDRGTVAWRLKTKNPHHPPEVMIHKPPPAPPPPSSRLPNPPRVQKQPSSLPKERTHPHHNVLHLTSQVRRRKSEPNLIVQRAGLVERSPNLLLPAGDGGAWNETTTDDAVAPPKISTATPNVVVHPRVDSPWKDFDLMIGTQENDQSWALSPMSSRSSSMLFGAPASPMTHASPHQPLVRPRHDNNDFSHEDRRDDIEEEEEDSDNDEEDPRREHRLIHIDLSPILQERTTATATTTAHDFPNVTSRSKSQRSVATCSVARSLSYQDDEPARSSSGEVSYQSQSSKKKYRQDVLLVPCSMSQQEEGRETSDHCHGVSSVLDEVLELDTFEPRVYGRGSVEKSPQDTTEHTRDHREKRTSVDSDQDDSPRRLTRDLSFLSAPSSHGEVADSLPTGDSITNQKQQSIAVASTTPQHPDGEGSFDWIDNLSPDEIVNRRVPSRRRTDFLPLIGSPLDRFRSQGTVGTGVQSASSSIDSDIEEGLYSTKLSVEDVAISVEPVSIDRVSDQCSDIDSETEAANSHDTSKDDEEGKSPATWEQFVKVNGKTLLQPVREIPSLQTQAEQEGNQCSCSCCLERKETWEEMGHQLSEMKWRAEIAELEKQKYHNQIYGLRKQYEVRVTPFRDIFEEMVKLKREKQSLLRENRESTVALESSVAALQMQMTEALTIAMQQNIELKDKLKESESQIKELQSSRETTGLGVLSPGVHNDSSS